MCGDISDMLSPYYAAGDCHLKINITNPSAFIRHVNVVRQAIRSYGFGLNTSNSNLKTHE